MKKSTQAAWIMNWISLINKIKQNMFYLLKRNKRAIYLRTDLKKGKIG